MRLQKIVTVWLFSVLALAGAQAEQVQRVILLIGDGMGIAHITAAGITKGRPLALERCEIVGLTKTHSADRLITDSAAAGTALATGSKTNYRVLGMDTKGRPLASLMELGQARGLATGFVVTSEVTHATPAAFYAHQPLRSLHAGIAAELLASKVDVAIGGGMRHFKDQLAATPGHLGPFQVVTDLEAARALPSDGRLLGLLADEWLPPYQRRGDTLRQGMREALRRLEQNPNGFFLMVEGSQIDLYSHERDAKLMLPEMIDFDRAVGYALDYAAANEGTLVVVVSDHETGGYAITGGDLAKREVRSEWRSRRHTGEMVPVFAHGPGAERFSGVYQNTDIFHKIVGAYGWQNAPTSRAAR